MEREKLKALLERSAESGFSVQSGVQLQEWLEKFAAGVKSRAEELQAQVNELVDHTSSVEQELKNTFNSFRLLSNTQFIENRVYEEDETLVPKQSEGEQQPRPQSYEDDIVPRYREAVALAWNAHEQASHLRDMKLQRLPYIIGTEEFMRDPRCGLPDHRNVASASSAKGYDSEAEKDGANMAAEMVGSGIISEGEWSEPSSDAVEDQEQDNQEPAVSAALDFKAMLEAALRGPYIPFNDGFSHPTNLESGTASSGDTVSKDAGEGCLVNAGGDESTVAKNGPDEEGATLHGILDKIAVEAVPGFSSTETASVTVSREPDVNSDGSSSCSVSSDEEDSSHVQVRSADRKNTIENKPPSPSPASKSYTDSSAAEYGQSANAVFEDYEHIFGGRSNSAESLTSLVGGPNNQLHQQEAASALRSTSRLSSLLFGVGEEDEDEEEAALFGPIKKI